MRLIQIISGETLQNVLPILVIKPSRVISLASKDTKLYRDKRVILKMQFSLPGRILRISHFLNSTQN